MVITCYKNLEFEKTFLKIAFVQNCCPNRECSWKSKKTLQLFHKILKFIVSTCTLLFQAKHYVDSFLSHCSRPFTLFLQLCGHNRARQRDKLAHLLEEFTTLQDEVRYWIRKK